ncbi:MAG: hypothetical protein IJI25_08765 [Eubacterium sp.]|nr:hypothetical protein [Eubacterium sp.]
MAFAKGNQYGKKPKYKSPDEIVGKIEAYFKDCEGELLRDHNGDPMLTKWGDPVYINRRPPTVTGLALALGFKTRRALMIYQAKKEFMDIILEAKSRIEMYNEEQLFTRDGSRGAQFSLQHNFAGWQQEKDDSEKGPAVNIINDIPKGQVTVNTDTAVFNPLQKPDEETEGNAKQ